MAYRSHQSGFTQNDSSVSIGTEGLDWDAGDLAILFVTSEAAARTVGTPIGWTAQATNIDSPTGDTRLLGVYTRVLQAGDSGPALDFNSSGEYGWYVHIEENLDGTTPFAAVVTDSNASGTSHTVDGVTTTAGQRVVLFISIDATGQGASGFFGFSSPSGATVTERLDSNLGGAQTIIGAADLTESSGATRSYSISSTFSDESVTAAVVLTAAAGGGAIVDAAAVLAGSGSLSGAAKRTRDASASISGSGTLTGAAKRIREAATSLTGSGALSASAKRTRDTSASASAQATLSAAAKRTRDAQANISGQGSLTATGRRTRDATVALTGAATLTAAGTTSTVVDAAASLAASGTLTASPRRVRNLSATVAAAAALTATAKRSRNIRVVLAGIASLSATAAGSGARATCTVTDAAVTFCSVLDRPATYMAAQDRPATHLTVTNEAV